MSIPPEPVAPVTVGLSPKTADEVNYSTGVMLRQFTDNKEAVHHFREWLAAADLKAAPYHFLEEQEVLIKSAIADLDTAMDAIDMTFITRLTGLW
jgi:hypothetical protein